MNRERSEGLTDAAMLVIVATAFSICAGVWLWGGLAGALFGRGWPAAGTSQLLSVLTRLPAHLANPAAAWPARARLRLPGPAGFYVTLGLLGGVCSIVVLLARRAGVALRSADAAAAGRQARRCGICGGPPPVATELPGD